jgi:hypothetical protein
MRSLTILLSVSAAMAGEWSKSYTVGRDAALDVRCDDAAVELVAGAPSRIEARLVTRGWEIQPGQVEVIESQSGDRVHIHVRIPKWRMDWGGNRSARLFLSVPPQLTVRVNTGDGSIRAQNISGDIRLSTGDGSITGEGMGGALEARTGDGSVRLDGRFDILRVNTGDGSVGVSAGPGSTVKSGWTIETGDGSVTVRIPRDLRADLEARTGDGHLSVDLPDFRTSGSHRDVKGRLNGGGLPLRVRSGDGSTTIAASR